MREQQLTTPTWTPCPTLALAVVAVRRGDAFVRVRRGGGGGGGGGGDGRGRDDVVRTNEVETSVVGWEAARSKALRGVWMERCKSARVRNGAWFWLARGLGECPQLHVLVLNACDVGKEDADALARVVPRCTALSVLHLREILLNARGVTALAAAIAQSASIQDVDFSLNPCTSDGANAMAEAIRRSKSLACVRLDKCDIDDVGAMSLAVALEESASMRKLCLRANALTDYATSRLAVAAMKNSRISTLSVRRHDEWTGSAAPPRALKCGVVNAVMSLLLRRPRPSRMPDAALPPHAFVLDKDVDHAILSRVVGFLCPRRVWADTVVPRFCFFAW